MPVLKLQTSEIHSYVSVFFIVRKRAEMLRAWLLSNRSLVQFQTMDMVDVLVSYQVAGVIHTYHICKQRCRERTRPEMT